MLFDMQSMRSCKNLDDSMDLQVLRLRRKLEIKPSMPHAILKERGIGYVFELPVEPL